MKYLKYFENIKKEPKVGDYILIGLNWKPGYLYKSENINYFTNTHIGKIYSIDDGVIRVWYDLQPEQYDNDEYFLCWFKYRTIKGVKRYFFEFEYKYTIKAYDKTITEDFYRKIEKYKMKMNADKYNI